jgi:DNA-binding MarR family transcriptional regulator
MKSNTKTVTGKKPATTPAPEPSSHAEAGPESRIAPRTDMSSFETFETVLILARIWDYLVTSTLRSDGITAQQYLFLAVISREFTTPPTLNQAARVLCMTHQNVRQLIDVLQRRGLAEARPDPEDRRTLRIHITDEKFIDSIRANSEISDLIQSLLPDGFQGSHDSLETLLVQARTLYHQSRRSKTAAH